MQDRYAGDVGDFGKFGLLRHLCGKTAQDDHPHLTPGVIWYRVADETHNGDGRHTSYLKKTAKSVKDKSVEDDNDPRFRDCDAHLYDALKKMVFRDQNRTIEALEGAQLLPGAVYWSEKIAAPRSHWLAGALHQTASCDLVFLDPDNGVAGLRAFAEGSPKHVFLDEIRSLIGRKPRPSLVIYHHMDKTKGTAEQKTERQLKCLSKELGLSSAEQPFGVLFRPWVVRAFLILPNQDHREMLMERTNALIQKWGKDEWGKRKPKPHFTGPIPA
jgi:hypothetical protein